MPPPGYRPLGGPAAGAERKAAGRRGPRVGGRRDKAPASEPPATEPAAEQPSAPGPQKAEGGLAGTLGGVAERLRALLRRGR